MSERKGFEWWDRLCKLPKFSFVIGTEGGVRRVEDSVGNWIEYAAAQAVVDDAQAEINVLRERLERLAPAPAPQPPSASGEREAFNRWATANGKFHTSGYNPHEDLFEAWQARAALAPATASVIERLRIHAADERNTAFARSTMNELLAGIDRGTHG